MMAANNNHHGHSGGGYGSPTGAAAHSERAPLAHATPIAPAPAAAKESSSPSSNAKVTKATLAEVEEAKSRAESRAKELEDKLRRLEVERAALQSDVAVLGVQMGALEAAGDEQRKELRREKAAAAEASAALEDAKREKAAAVEEREFTIEAQAGMLQQLSSELERAERCREEAERSKVSR